MAVQPRVFREVIASLLAHIGVDDVVVVDGSSPTYDTTFDAAIVTTVPDWLDAQVVIEVPSDGAVSPLGRVSTGGAEFAIPLTTLQQLLVAVDTYCATTVSRVELLDVASRPKDH